MARASIKRMLAYSTCIGSIVASTGTAWAQNSQDEEFTLEEIIVTAQKREQSLNDVGIAVTAFTGDAIQRLGLEEPVDLAAYTPNVNINETFGRGIVNVSVRGIGLNDYAVNNNPAAGIYIDDVYLVSPAMLSFQLFDLERVEVLKGPQGTLYGKNTTAGAVKFISRKPTDETEGYIRAEYGRFDKLTVDGAIGGQVAEGFNVRLSGQTTQQFEGFQTNRLTGEDVGDIHRTSLRLLADWQVTDNFSLFVNVHGGRDTSDSILFNVNNILDPSDDEFFDEPFNVAGGGPIGSEIENFGFSVTANWNLSDQWSVVSITGYEDYSRFYQEDRDGSALVHLDGFFDNEIEQFSQELRATFTSEEFFLTFGGFYGTDTVDTRDQFDSVDLLPLFGLAGSTGIGNFYSQETDSSALFVHAEWQATETLKLTGGLRYTNDQKDLSNAFTFLVVPDLNTGGGGLCPLPPVGDPSAVNVSDGVQIGCFDPFSADFSVNDLAWKVGIDYTGIEDTLLYASVGTGFKSGGFQGQLTFNPADLNPFDEENLVAYEIGFKTQLANNRLQLNGAAFYYDYTDLQFYGPLFDSPFGPLFGIDNAGDASIYGGEIELNWLITEGWDIQAGLGLLDTEVENSVLPGVASGSELPNSPNVNFNLQTNYQWNISDNLVGDISLATSYKGDVSYDIVRQPPETLEDGYWLVNARIGVTGGDGDWSVYLWGRNIFDERYRTQVLTSSIGFVETFGDPATYGVGFQLNF